MTAWSAFQNDIYIRGTDGGELPVLPTDLLQLEQLALELMSDEARGYIGSSAGSSDTMRENRAAFDRWRILPRVLNGVADRSIATEVAGLSLAAPLLLAPVGVQTLAHPDGELATARAAATTGVTYIHSQAASHSFEEIARVAGTGPRWFQLYCVSDRDVILSFLDRAHHCGFTALVVTVDTVVLGWRPADLNRGYLPFLRGVGVQNYTTDPAFMSAIPASSRHDASAIGKQWLKIFPHAALSWSDLAFIREHWTGPILIKGIQHPDDAIRAIGEGLDGVIVSNHGGRQIDGGMSTIDSLGGVVDAVDGRVPVLVDSGVRTGADVVKALALGARAVLVGRSFLYGLALAGEAGVEHVIRCTLAEFELAMALSGCATPQQLCRDHVRARLGPT